MYITLDAGRQIHKLLEKQGLQGGGLRVGVKAGGCSGLSYVFAWEAQPAEQDQVFEGPEDSRIYVDPKSFRLLEGTADSTTTRASSARVSWSSTRRPRRPAAAAPRSR